MSACMTSRAHQLTTHGARAGGKVKHKYESRIMRGFAATMPEDLRKGVLRDSTSKTTTS